MNDEAEAAYRVEIDELLRFKRSERIIEAFETCIKDAVGNGASLVDCHGAFLAAMARAMTSDWSS